MAKTKSKKNLSLFSFKKSIFKIIKKNNDNSKIYRCKYCRIAKIKKEEDNYIKIRGHEKNCKVFKNKNLNKNKIQQIYSDNEDDSNDLQNDSKEDKLVLKINENKIIENMNNNIYNSNYLLLKKDNKGKIFLGNFVFFPKRLIGKGCFVNTYFGYNIINLEEVAIKISKEKEEITTCAKEIEILKMTKGLIGFPEIKGICKFRQFDVIIQDLLGPSLKKIIGFHEIPFTEPTICRIGIQILKRLKELHKLNILHNDLKPSNFAWGVFKNNQIESNNKIFLIDFGLCSKIKYFENKVNLKIKTKNVGKKNEKDQKKFNKKGNLLYMSYEVLKGNEPSKKSELQSFCYLLIYFFNLSLPWSGIKTKNEDDKIKKIIDIHKNLNEKTLCQNLPYQILFIVSQINQLDINDTPNYDLYITVLYDLIRLNKKEKYYFCWERDLIEFYNIKEKNKIDIIKKRKFKELFEGYYNF